MAWVVGQRFALGQMGHILTWLRLYVLGRRNACATRPASWKWNWRAFSGLFFLERNQRLREAGIGVDEGRRGRSGVKDSLLGTIVNLRHSPIVAAHSMLSTIVCCTSR